MKKPKLYDLRDCDGESCGIFSTVVPEGKIRSLIEKVREDVEYDSNLLLEELAKIDPDAAFVSIEKIAF